MLDYWYIGFAMLGLWLSIGYLVYIVMRDAEKRKKEKNSAERQLERFLKEKEEAEKKDAGEK
ncbi:MAG: hypothetical protein V2A74_05365 [bacterium]